MQMPAPDPSVIARKAAIVTKLRESVEFSVPRVLREERVRRAG